MRVLLVDDIFEARDDLKYSLAHYPDVVVVADVDTTDTAWGLIEQGGIDVVFLDIRFDNMPDGDRAGFDLAVSINQLHTPPLVVFFTAFPEFALEAFRFFPFSFLPRPYSGQQLEEVLSKLRLVLANRLHTPPAHKSVLVFQHKIKDQDGSNILCTEFVMPHDIVFIKKNPLEATLKVRLSNGKTLNGVVMTLAFLETQLHEHGLIRVHNSSIAAIRHISGLKKFTHNETYKISFKTDPEELSVGPVYLSALLAALSAQ